MEVFRDLYRTVDDKAAKALADAVSSGRKGATRQGFRVEEPVGWLIDTNIWIAVERG
jgi:hypothetical protein